MPALNEEATIRRIVTRVRKLIQDTIVVDDRNTARTKAVAERSGATVMQNQFGKGSGWPS